MSETERPRVPGRQHGIALPSWNTEDYNSPVAPAYLRGIAATGADWIQLNPTWYQESTSDSALHTTSETASDESIRSIVGSAHEYGLKVLLKPHLDLTSGGDRAEIKPKDLDAWFRSYQDFITHYAELATELKVEEFAVGTELAGVQEDRARWSAVIDAVRGEYSGPLVYAANFDNYRKVAFWDLMDVVGIDAYFELSEKPTISVLALQEGWRQHVRKLERLSEQTGKRILFTEAGYASQRGATVEPYSWELSEVPANEEQAAAYEALLATFTDKLWWAGVHWWMWDDWPDAGETPKELAFTPHGKPAEQVLKRWWRHNE